MLSRFCTLPFLGLLAISLLGCNNTLNPLCSSARPAPVIGSLSPSTLSFAQVQQGATLTIDGSHFVSASEVMVNTTPLAATVVSSQELQIQLSSDVISGPGTVKIAVTTPGGNTSDLGCTSGGTSTALTLNIN